MGFLPQSGIPTVFREGRIRSRLIGKEDDSSPVIREEEECLSEESKLLFLQNIKAFRDAMGVQMILRHIDHLPETLLVDIFNPLIQKVSDVRQPTKKAYRLTSDRPLVSSGVQLCSSECLQVRQVCSISAGTAFSCLNFRLFRIISSNVTGSKPFMSVPAFSICSLPASSGQ